MRQLIFLALSAMAVAAIIPPARAQDKAAPSPEALSLARSLVEKSGATGQMVMAGLIMPPPGFMTSLGVTEPQQVQAISHDAVMPALGDHESALTDIQVKSYASLLSVADMKAAIAFFDSPAGMKFVRARHNRVQDEMAKGSELIAKFQPEIEEQVKAVSHAHGWPG